MAASEIIQVKFSVKKAELNWIDFLNHRIIGVIDLIPIRIALFEKHSFAVTPRTELARTRIHEGILEIKMSHACKGGAVFDLKGSWRNSGSSVTFEAFVNMRQCSCSPGSVFTFLRASKDLQIEIKGTKKRKHDKPAGLVYNHESSSAIGKCFFAVVHSYKGKKKPEGGIGAVYAARLKQNQEVLRFTLETKQCVRDAALNAYAAVISYLERRNIQSVVFNTEILVSTDDPDYDSPLSGNSIGMSIVVALLSLALKKAPPANTVYTGAIVPTGEFHAIGGVLEKQAGAAENGFLLYLPKENENDIEPNICEYKVLRNIDELTNAVFPK